MPDLPVAVTISRPVPLKMNWPSPKSTAFSSSAEGVSV